MAKGVRSTLYSPTRPQWKDTRIQNPENAHTMCGEVVGNLKLLICKTWQVKITGTRILWFNHKYRHERKELATIVRQIKRDKSFDRDEVARNKCWKYHALLKRDKQDYS